MTSNCPQCKKAVEHEDYMFEVRCDCGSRFNPFMDASNTFEEGQAALEEIAQFALGQQTSEAPAAAHAAAGGSPSEPPVAEVRSAPTAAFTARTVSDSEPILTAGDSLPGYRIENYLAPVSTSADLDPNHNHPLKAGFDALWAQAVASGATGIVAMRWVLSPDGTRVVLSGTPVVCTKEPG
ncbi:hypothetical protein K2X33_01825 [bacterium]|nr:hypothetical protein [bacterium]